MQKSRLIFVLILASACNQLRGVAGVPLESFYPFGSAAGDASLPRNDDGSSPPKTLSIARFPFFDEDHSTVFVNNNGMLSFTRGVSQFTPDPFPLAGDRQLIAPYWADVDTRGTGTVWYRETTRPQLLQRAGDEIQAAFISQGSFAPSYIFIATWERVGYFNQHTDRTNTFQCVMATDGINSFVIYLYADGLIQWTTGDASGGSGGLGGTPAQVGFNAGDSIRFANVPGSRTAEIINIAQTSNVGVTGVWIFRVDSEEIVVAGCSFEPDAILTIAPRLGSVLGGTVVSFSGPCLEETDNITCVFDGVEVEGIFINMMLGVCVSPPLSAVGRLSFQLRVVNASRFTRFEGDEAFFSIPTFEDGLTVRNGFSVDIDSPDLTFQTGDFFFLRWSPQMIVPIANPTSYTVNITLYGLTDPDTEIWTEIITLASNLPNTGQAFFRLPDLSMSGIPDVCPTSIQVGLGGTTALTRPQNDTVIERLAELGTVTVSTGVWSAVGYAIELVDRDLRLTCEEWCESQPEGIGEQLNGQVMPCPPTLEQANRDNRFDRENPLVSGTFHSGTAGCFRQVITGNQCRSGSQCCYGRDGNLIVGSPNGGTIDRVSPQGSLRCYLDHFLQDVVPVVYCCAGLNPDCEAYYEKRPSTSSTGYRFPVPAPPPGPGFSQASYMVAEDAGSVSVCIDTTSTPVSVNVTTVDGTATAGVDYMGLSNELNIVSSKECAIIVILDDMTVVQGSRSFRVELTSNDVTARVTTTVIITDTTMVNVAYDDAPSSVAEGGSVMVCVVASGATLERDVIVTIAPTAASTATGGGTDYQDFSQDLTFSGTTTRGCVIIAAVTDMLVEGSETIMVELTSSDPAASITQPTTIVTITDETKVFFQLRVGPLQYCQEWMQQSNLVAEVERGIRRAVAAVITENCNCSFSVDVGTITCTSTLLHQIVYRSAVRGVNPVEILQEWVGTSSARISINPFILAVDSSCPVPIVSLNDPPCDEPDTVCPDDFSLVTRDFRITRTARQCLRRLFGWPHILGQGCTPHVGRRRPRN